MSRQHLGRAALLAYPRRVRSEHGKELLGTLLDAGDASCLVFLRELVSLLIGGLVGRSQQTFGRPLAPIAMEALCWSAVMSIVRPLSAVLFTEIGPTGFQRGSTATILIAYVGPGLLLVLFTVGKPRATGLVGLAWAEGLRGLFAAAVHINGVRLRSRRRHDRCGPYRQLGL